MHRLRQAIAPRFAWGISILAVAAACYGGWPATAAAVTPLPHAHAHNDYEHDRPLLDALDNGFCSIEADVFAVDGDLLVAHDREDCSPERTLRSLYLDPLKARVDANGGRVYPDGPPVILLIDFKSDGAETWPVLKAQLADYEDMLTAFTDSSTDEKAVTVIISGSSPRDLVAAEPRRLAAIDGRSGDLEANPSVHLVPLISENWFSTFRWGGRKDMPDEVFTKLQAFCTKAHEQGRIVRFWAAPENEYVWTKMREANLDLMNADHLKKLRAFLTAWYEAHPGETARHE